MLPEFCKLVFSFTTDSEIKQEKNILYHLQKLFTQLLLSDKKCIGTRELTNSFGWNDHNVAVQQDAQELRIVLFSVFEKYFTHASNQSESNRINPSNLFEGNLEAYINCNDCNYRSKRNENFYEIQVCLFYLKRLN